MAEKKHGTDRITEIVREHYGLPKDWKPEPWTKEYEEQAMKSLREYSERRSKMTLEEQMEEDKKLLEE